MSVDPRMRHTVQHKGYTGLFEFDEESAGTVGFDRESGTFFARAIKLRDVITAQGDSLAEAAQAFRDSVDDYLEFCAERGESPEKPAARGEVES
jgi:predicted HicB family RNase H-like nuclease